MKTPIFCIECSRKTPAKIRTAVKFVPVRPGFYDIDVCGNIDKRVIGVCQSCYDEKNEFQKANSKCAKSDGNVSGSVFL